MHRDRGTVPYRAGFSGGVIADGDHQINWRRVVSTESIPRLRLEAVDAVTLLLQLFDRAWIDSSRWMTAGAEGLDVAAAKFIDQHFAENASSGIPRTQEKNGIGSRHDGDRTTAG